MKFQLLCLSILLSLLSFSQTEIDPFKNVEKNDLGNARLVDKKGNGLTPFVFIQLEYVGKDCYVFTADVNFRGDLKDMISNNIDDQTKRLFNEEEFDEEMEMKSFNEVNIFKGILSSKGEIIGAESYRMVDFIVGTEKNPMFAAQDQSDFELNQTGKLALINEKGQELTPFEFEFLAFEKGKIIGAKVDDKSNTLFVTFNKKGKVIEEKNPLKE